MAHGTFRYRAFGLRLESELQLGSLPEVVQHPDVSDTVKIRVHPAGTAAPSGGGVRIAWDQVCELGAAEGRRLDVYPRAEATAADIELTILGAGLALILEQRGTPVLHGSCALVGSVAVALVGASGAGKSTIAGALAEAGHRVISDGMTAVELADNEAWALPGLPLLKLLPDAAKRLGFDVARAGRVHPSSPKLLCDVSASFVDEKVPLRGLLVLSTDAPIALTPLAPSAAAFALTKNFFLIDELGPTRAESILKSCARLAERVSVQTLGRAGLGELAQVVRLVEAAAQGLRS